MAKGRSDVRSMNIALKVSDEYKGNGITVTPSEIVETTAFKGCLLLSIYPDI